MSLYERHSKAFKQSKIAKKNYSPESTTELDDMVMDARNPSMIIDNNNVIMKTPQSLDDLLDVDDVSNENPQDNDDNQSDHNDPDDDNDSTHLSIDNLNATESMKQRKSIKKNGKIQ